MKKIPLLKSLFLIGILMFNLLPNMIYADSLSIQYDSTTLADQWAGKIKCDYWKYSQDSQYNEDIYVYNFQFDKQYIGYIQFNVRFSGQTNWASGYERVLVVGYEGMPMYYPSYTVNNTNSYINAIKIIGVQLTELDDYGGDLSSIISYLQSIDATEDDIYSVLQSISSDTNTIANLRQWNFPLNSYGFVSKYYTDSSKTYIDIFDNGYWTYPLFSTSNDFVYQFTNNKTYDLVLGINKNVYGISTFNQVFTLSNATIDSCYYVQQGKYHNDDFYIFHAKITRSGSNSFLRLIDYSNVVLMPVYCDYSEKTNFTTDFALVFGFSNQLLNDLHIIAQGTNQSQTSVSAADQQNATFSDQASDLVNTEDQLITNFESALQNVQPNINPSDFGSNFLHSAEWVRDQYNNLVNNTPFASLITFSLVLGVGLLIIGRVLK